MATFAFIAGPVAATRGDGGGTLRCTTGRDAATIASSIATSSASSASGGG